MSISKLTKSEVNMLRKILGNRLEYLNEDSLSYAYDYSGHVPDWLKTEIQELETLLEKLKQ